MPFAQTLMLCCFMPASMAAGLACLPKSSLGDAIPRGKVAKRRQLEEPGLPVVPGGEAIKEPESGDDEWECSE